MRAIRPLAPLLIVLAVVASQSACKPSRGSELKESVDYPDYDGYEGANMSPAEERGRRIWYEAVGDNGRFHTYVTPQKIGAPQNWGKVLSTKTRDKRWHDWGMIPDPDCKPGVEGAPDWGFDVCRGDRESNGIAGDGYQPLQDFVGKDGYKDPGCWISGQYKAEDCPLGLGTSTGALGYRKFPNPRFDAANWPGWEAYDPFDGSVEPPFLIGVSCGSCHITFNPLDPPQDPNHPKWRNIKGLVGNQYINVEEITGSGLDPHSLEWQAAITARAGTVDTSAHPNDLVHNPGTINSIINLDRRPPGLPPFKGEAFASFDKEIVDEHGQKSTQRVFNILKGGEDDVGGAGAILRVYINIGTCSEPCWMNHLLDNRSVDGRNSQQTPFSQVQCRRDCPSYVALEKFYPDVIQFFLSKAGRPTDLKDAIFADQPPEQRAKKLAEKLGEDKIKTGRKVYAEQCAKCHSSQKPPEGQEPADFFKDLVAEADQTGVDPFTKEENGVRLDWLGNEEREPVTKIGVFRCRSLHSNHMRGHVWDEFSSETYKKSPTPPGIPELKGQEGGGRGYMRNVSLLSVWTQAPFLHNNAIGPELCNHVHEREGPCIEKDPSVEGRLKLFEDSMKQLLNPGTRGRKITVTDADIIVPVGPQPGEGVTASFTGVPYLSKLGLLLKLYGGPDIANALQGAKVVIPKGTPVALLASLDYRKLVKGLADQVAQAPLLERPKKLVGLLNAMFGDPKKLADILAGGPAGGDPNKYNGYSNCTDVIEDKGHEFGSQLSEAEKDALIAFMKTL